ncbi:MAG: prephenate dehydratase [Candidatus Eremiobacteraeota bacterium]|nr:prephenate dehydratase [Candidatus Eremiobacteraeota bacterium]
MDLAKVREKIDLIDKKLINLLEERMELSLRAQKLKQEVEDRNREEEVMHHVAERSGGLVYPSFTRRLFELIIGESKRLQKNGYRLIGFQGEHGAYGEVATRAWDTHLAPIPCIEFADVFDSVSGKKLDFGMVPVENSLEGAVTQVNDLLIDTDLHIVGEVVIPVHHCLLALPDTDYREIKVVYSHPQALAQCRGFITRNALEMRPYYDTAGAAKMLARDMPHASAAIASSLAAELYNLQVIKENIEDHPSNFTRFVVLSREKAPMKGEKCSIVFSAAHRAGTLFGVLRLFAEAGINLTRIESRPLRNDPGHYVFFLDLLGDPEDRAVAAVLGEVEKATVKYKLLGSYGRA